MTEPSNKVWLLVEAFTHALDCDPEDPAGTRGKLLDYIARLEEVADAAREYTFAATDATFGRLRAALAAVATLDGKAGGGT